MLLLPAPALSLPPVRFLEVVPRWYSGHSFVLDHLFFSSLFGSDWPSVIPSFSLLSTSGINTDTCGSAEGMSLASRTADLLSAPGSGFQDPRTSSETQAVT